MDYGNRIWEEEQSICDVSGRNNNVFDGCLFNDNRRRVNRDCYKWRRGSLYRGKCRYMEKEKKGGVNIFMYHLFP